MAKIPNGKDDNDELSDFDFPEKTEDEDEDFFSEADDIFDELTEEETDTDTEETSIETETHEEELVAPPVEQKEKESSKPQKQETKKEAPQEHFDKDSPIVIEQIPMSITIEIGRIQMPMEKLLNLSPGNILNIDLHPKNGVDLTVNGKVVAKGELVKIGEAIGIRVIQLG